jgi:hypothetical protein
MLELSKATLAIFVDRSSNRWIVRDTDGSFWLLPPVAEPWQHREAYQPAEDAELEPVPAHYKYLLGLPL